VPFRDTVKLLGDCDTQLAARRWTGTLLKLYAAATTTQSRALRHIRPLLTLDVANTIRRSIVASRLDYANALLHGTSAGNLDMLQVTQNSLARTVLQAPYFASATELRQQLNWLPICQLIFYKLAIITYKTRSTGTPAYLSQSLPTNTHITLI